MPEPAEFLHHVFNDHQGFLELVSVGDFGELGGVRRGG